MAVLLGEISPHNNKQAVVDDDHDVVVFYLVGLQNSGFGMRSCWVRNLKPAPAELDVRAMRDGKPPLLPEPNCIHKDSAPPLIPDQLRIVWFEEGDGAALFEGDEALAIIPGWSGQNGFHGLPVFFCLRFEVISVSFSD